jgi:ubiquinone/menaquinone biosynthesis C-methylase UbiE
MIDYDVVALEYARHRRVHPEVLRDLVSTSGVGTGSKVLEIGCGTGNYIIALQELADCSCWGVDPSAEMLSRAKERSARIIFGLGRGERLGFPPDFFDLVFSVDVVHHLEDHLAYFSEAHRILKLGGEVCTVTDSAWIIRHRLPLALYFPQTVEVDLERYPRISELRELMEQAGFSGITGSQVGSVYQLTDIQAYREKAFSSLQLISEEAHRKGIERLERDLRTGSIPCVSRYLLLWGTK